MNKLILHGIYRHYKGDQYIVEDVALHSETKEELVIYRALYGDRKLYARPKTMFLEEINPAKCHELNLPTQKYRFELQTIKSIAPPRTSLNRDFPYSELHILNLMPL